MQTPSRTILILTFIMFFCGLGFAANEFPKANKGIMHLENWDFEKNGSLSLNGEWEFYWNQFIFPETAGTNITKPDYIQVPGAWNSQKIKGNMLPRFGYSTFRLIFTCGTNQNILAGIKIPEICSAYNLFINGKLEKSTGKISTGKNGYVPRWKPASVFFELNRQTNEIILQAANFDHLYSGIEYPLILGTIQQINSEQQRSSGFEMFLFGALLITGFYHIGLFLYRRKERSVLYFGIFCLLVALRTIIAGERQLIQILPDLPWEWVTKTEYLVTFLAPLFFNFYINGLFEKALSKNYLIVQQVVTYSYCLIILLLPESIYSALFNYFFIFILVAIFYLLISLLIASYRKKEGAIIVVVGFMIFSLCTINDLLFVNLIIHTGLFLPLGVFIFIFSQSFLLSIRFSNAFNKVEDLSMKLEALNLSLEDKVRDRTEELTQTLDNLTKTQQSLIHSEKMAALGQLISGIAHEINTPLGAIGASISNISAAMKETLSQLPEIMKHCTDEQYSAMLHLLDLVKDPVQISSREVRAIKKTIASELADKNIPGYDNIAEMLVNMEFLQPDKINEILPIIKDQDSAKYLKTAFNLSRQNKNSHNIEIAIGRVTKILFALKNFARQEQSYVKTATNIAENIETVLTLYHNNLKKGIEVVKQYEKVPLTYCNPDEMGQVWTNIIHNAIQAMENKGTLKIKIFSKNNFIHVSITDSGTGIPPEIQSRIFEAFFTTKPRGEGTGMGLNIVQKIIDKHHGKIEVESIPGKTTINVLIPILETEN